jgi:transcriptional regulator with XRE-family HTH domain
MAKRESIGERLNRARLELEMSVPQLRGKILRDHRFEVGESTIRDVEADRTPNPGRKTIEFIALGVGLDPLEVFALGLDDRPEMEAGYTETQFAQLARVYKKVGKEYRPIADEFVKMLIEKMERWR